MFFFKWKELTAWLGLTLFEIWIHLVAFTIFLALLAMKLEDAFPYSWSVVLTPLFVGDGLNMYFRAIIWIRCYIEGQYKQAVMRICYNLVALSLMIGFKYLLCKKLSGLTDLEYSEVMSPVFVLLQLIAIRACQFN